jgi:arylsulfatase A-like enzyme
MTWVPGFLAILALLLAIPGLHWLATLILAAGLSSALTRRISSNEARFARMIRLTLPALVVALSLILGTAAGRAALAGKGFATLGRDEMTAVTRGRLAPKSEGRPNVLLIVLDTVRAESLSLYGAERKTSPRLVRLARRGVRFDQARAPAPWTLPSHATMFTGRWPHELNVGEHRPLDTRYPTLAEFLAARGYATAGFVANTYFCNSWYGLARGFDHYEDFHQEDVAVSVTETLRCSNLGRRLLQWSGVSGVERTRKTAAQINRDFLDWLNRQEGRPFFAFLNYFDAHSPYLLPAGCEHHFGTRPESPADEALLRDWENRPRQGVSPRELALARDAYDDCIAYLDRELGNLFDRLQTLGVLDETLIVVTSDHGEHLGEHGLFGHGKSLYSQETRIPLIIVPPGGLPAGRVVEEPVSLRDLPATVADVVGGLQESPFPGRSLTSSWNIPEVGSAMPPLSPAISEVALRIGSSRNPNRPPAWKGPMSSLASGTWHYIRNADGVEELYNLRQDPGDVRDFAMHPEAAPELRRLRVLLDQTRRVQP